MTLILSMSVCCVVLVDWIDVMLVFAVDIWLCNVDTFVFRVPTSSCKLARSVPLRLLTTPIISLILFIEEIVEGLRLLPNFSSSIATSITQPCLELS